MNSPFYKNLALWMVIGLIVIVLFNVFQASQPSRDKMVFSDFLKRVAAGPSAASSRTATPSAPSRPTIPI